MITIANSMSEQVFSLQRFASSKDLNQRSLLNLIALCCQGRISPLQPDSAIPLSRVASALFDAETDRNQVSDQGRFWPHWPKADWQLSKNRAAKLTFASRGHPIRNFLVTHPLSRDQGDNMVAPLPRRPYTARSPQSGKSSADAMKAVLAARLVQAYFQHRFGMISKTAKIAAMSRIARASSSKSFVSSRS